MTSNSFALKKQSLTLSGSNLRSGALLKKLELAMQQPASASSSSKQSSGLKRARGKTTNAEQILQYLESVADYDPELGGFIVHTQPANARSDKVGKQLGYRDTHGYLNILIAGITWKQSRLVWLWHHGSWPTFKIDHINGIRDDDRIENLRDVPQRLNCCNQKRKSNNKTGVTGISFISTHNKYLVTVNNNSKQVRIGSFNTLPAAARALATYHKKNPGLGYTARHLQSLYDYLATLPALPTLT